MRILWALARVTAISAILFTSVGCGPSATPPEQPDVGPGSNQYLHGEVLFQGPYYGEGTGEPEAYLYYIVEPASPKPESAPVVLFLHAQFVYNPATYDRWMTHLARKGYVVVWPLFDSGLQGFDKFGNNIMVAWKDALNRLETEPGHVRPARTRDGRLKSAFIGHSIGGYYSAITATRAVYWENEIEIPFLVACFSPGGFGSSPDQHFQDMDPDTALLIAIGDKDIAINRENQVDLWNKTAQLRPERKQFLLVQSDSHGSPKLTADHSWPKTSQFRGEEDALDWYGTYKFSLGALNCVFYDTSCEYAFGNGSEAQTFMGTWSDGIPVAPTIYLDDPEGYLLEE